MLVMAVLLFLALPASPQTAAATLLVDARDQNGAPLPGVVVTVTSEETGLQRAATTANEGTAWLVRLPAGTYTLSAVRGGFKTEVVRNVRLDASADARIALVFKAGAYTEEVVVEADASTLTIGNSAVGAIFDAATLQALPVPEREVLEFAGQAAGVAPPAPGSRLSTQGNTGVNSAGARESSNNYLLDGLDNNDQFLNRLVINPSLDAVQEFSLLQNTYDAEHGRSAGAQLNMVLKSGTRAVHGTLYEFFRDSALDARPALAPADLPKPERQRHQFGGTIGGPLWLPLSFYFVSAEAINGREADTRLAHVPTAAERAGDFSASGISVRDPFTGQPFTGNVIPTPRLSAAGQAAANLYPLPNVPGAQTNFAASPLANRAAAQFTIKTDHSVWQGSPLMLRYSFSRDDRDQPFPVRARNLPGFGISVLDQGHNAAGGLTKAFTARLFNELRVGVNALRRENLPQSAGSDRFAALGITGPAISGSDLGYPTLVVPGFETLGDDPNLPVVRRTRTLHISDTLTLDRGRHHIKTGGEIRRYRSDGYNHLFARGQATFTGAFSGSPLGDLLLGFPTVTLLGVNDNRQALRTWSAYGFLQDDWRAGRRLTVNAGVRYEFNAPAYDTDDRMRILDLSSLQLRQVGEDGISRSGLRADRDNVAPRLGVSWDLTGSGNWVARGGYGMFYDAATLIENSALYFNPPYWTLSLWVPNPAPVTLANPFPAGRAISPRPAINTIDPQIRTPYAQEASAGLDGVVKGTSFAARYVTSYGYDLTRKRNLNQAAPGPGTIDSRRPIATLGDVLLVESTASSSYHALQLTVTRRGRAAMLRGAYTLSKSMDDTSAFLATDGDDNTPQNSRDLAAEWGPSDFDVRQRFVFTASLATPDAGLPAVLRNWQASAVFTAQSGRPFTPRVSFDNSNTGNVGGGTFAYDRPNVVPASSTALPPPGARTYGGRTFVIAPQYTFGNAGRNSLVGPGYATLDAMISRRIQLPRRRQLTLRVELFNALNRRNLQLPDSFVDRVTFGRSLAAYAPRQVQLAARFTF
ncbi:MAG TPA: TonB-dependent receptor [Vicinamibacterales bacterium]|nr:TonB-dependent receptor [Vicinamibacterales bacterium]